MSVAPSRTSAALRVLLAVSLTVGAATAVYVWWVLGVRIDAADAMTDEPAAAVWGGAGLIALGLGIAGAVAAVVMGRRRAKQDR
ncbi:hypothetical protein [Pseudarthrobacter sp. S9]|uniref:hypothetical protein n=1 Tax=Pseudarthrobacter sp. S9 TaxID=3418421 RepID=UPI003D05C7B8